MLAPTGVGQASTGAEDRPTDELTIETVSNRADLVSGGDVLTRVNLPAGVRPTDLSLTLNGKRVREVHPSGDGRSVLTDLDGLRTGTNTVAARAGGHSSVLTVTNHPIGGPIFTGPQIQPWFCDTEKAGLGPATDRQCNAPTRYRFFYRAPTGTFLPYDPEQPPPAAAMTTTTIDTGRTVPYVVRVESTTINRGISFIAALFDPAQPWAPWAPQPGWNGKLSWIFGGDCAPGHRQGTDPSIVIANGGRYGTLRVPSSPVPSDPDYSLGDLPESDGQDVVLDDLSLSRGFMVASSTMTNLGNSCNTAVHAETMMMTKEHIIEQYGPIRYTMGTGCSGGSISQHGIAAQYPGLLQGIRPMCAFPDIWSILTVNSVDCPLLNRYFDTTAAGSAFAVTQRDAVYGYENGTVFCHQPLGNYRPSIWDPSIGGAGTNVACQRDGTTPLPRAWDHLEV